ncbi:hypothetical protein [Nocardia xishanensis]|uniref:hypothetical protein n=1 Tax=Nocardia xishanensis TaxID=238964 RepID=UPI000AE045A0|nr:hypothetical protein [Nocardia xishanensis]
MSAPKPGDLVVWYVPMPPVRSYTQPVQHLVEAIAVLDHIRLVQTGRPTQIGVSRWEPDGDGEFEWTEVEAHELDEVKVALAAQ